MDRIKIQIKNLSNNPLPEYKTNGSVGMDLQAYLNDSVILHPGCRMLVPTGIKIGLPEGYEAQVRPRSGLALKNGITCLNTPGTIDSDYRGEIGVILINHSAHPFTINPGDRIAQLVINKVEIADFVEVEELSDTERGEGGFGHTGK